MGKVIILIIGYGSYYSVFGTEATSSISVLTIIKEGGGD